MCVYLFAPSRGQPLCFSLCTSKIRLKKVECLLNRFRGLIKLLKFVQYVILFNKIKTC